PSPTRTRHPAEPSVYPVTLRLRHPPSLHTAHTHHAAASTRTPHVIVEGRS
ncbi:hypothetical protein STRTUCAR8_04477, partial [Streptomyces turgidiscabies Car8]